MLFRAVLGASSTLLGPSWALLRSSWRPLRLTWNGFGSLLGRLGAPGRPGAENMEIHQTINSKTMKFASRGLLGGPLGTPSAPQGAAWAASGH
eukprot:5239944-Pyramimonas_sp.AAC.1